MPSWNSNETPRVVKTATISSVGNKGTHDPLSPKTNKAVLHINGSLITMAAKWSEEEWDNCRRIVMFKKSMSGSILTVSFRAIPVNERPPNSICISCIWWAEQSECYITSVDMVYLVEQLVVAPNRLSLKEKNYIRRYLEGFHPSLVSKAKPDSKNFFKLVMSFPHPRPRNLERNIKVYPWLSLEPALKKIIGKYSAQPTTSGHALRLVPLASTSIFDSALTDSGNASPTQGKHQNPEK
jgi:hypothetical protein